MKKMQLMQKANTFVFMKNIYTLKANCEVFYMKLKRNSGRSLHDQLKKYTPK